MSEDLSITAFGDCAAVDYFPAIDKHEADAFGGCFGVQEIGFGGDGLWVEHNDIGVVALL